MQFIEVPHLLPGQISRIQSLLAQSRQLARLVRFLDIKPIPIFSSSSSGRCGVDQRSSDVIRTACNHLRLLLLRQLFYVSNNFCRSWRNFGIATFSTQSRVERFPKIEVKPLAPAKGHGDLVETVE